MVDGAQQPCSDEVLPATPGLGGAGVLDVYQLIRVDWRVPGLVDREACPWDKRDDGRLDRLCI